MPKVQVHGNQITLPDDLRNVLTNAADDAIEAEKVEEGVLLKPSVAMRRAAGLADIRNAQSGVRYTGGARPSPEQEERQIADILAADKDDTRNTRR
jgi:bifunctional DNA-binding transcriptional regulator/antitoxin component of YhaV-PrlF toxin-antitoxin module